VHSPPCFRSVGGPPWALFGAVLDATARPIRNFSWPLALRYHELHACSPEKQPVKADVLFRLSRDDRLKIKAIFWGLLALQFLITGFASAANGETQVTFTAQDIQAIIEKAPKSKALIDGLILVSLEDSPVIRLGQSPNRFGVSARLAIQVAGAKAVSVKIGGSGSVIYSEPKKAFFLDAPLIETIDAPFVPKALDAALRTAITNRLVKRFSTSPIYALRENGPMKERRDWRLLKSIQIRKNEVVATYTYID